MLSRRRWVWQLCVGGCIVIYMFAHVVLKTGPADFISELQQSGRNLEESAKNNAEKEAERVSTKPNVVTETGMKEEGKSDTGRHLQLDQSDSGGGGGGGGKNADPPIENDKSLQKIEYLDPASVGENDVVKYSDSEQNVVEEKEKSVPEKVKEILNCTHRPMLPKTQQRGDYWVLYNYVRAEKKHDCFESVTYTTHADYTFMDNLVPLVERWKGPVSVAMHAPGTDFAPTLSTIGYLRDCTSPYVKKYVTFHVYFSTKHVPRQVPRHDKVLLEPHNCSLIPPYMTVNLTQMYKNQKGLLYPVNVGRNVARESAQTHFILASDIELYPSPDLIPQFLEMIADNRGPLLRKNPRVFVLSIFEVAANYEVPENKTKLKEMLSNGTAVPFHKKVCHVCHNVPKAKEWAAANETKGLHIFHIGKRYGSFVHWEPIYIGTHADPLYDERLSWEGKSDKMTQGYALCVMDYDFQILDNAFLCHKPGIKTYKRDSKRDLIAAKTNQLIKRVIFPELKILYGVRKGCAI